MPAQLTYPGVYVEELPSAVRTITAVTTSVTAFVGPARRGPTDTARTITSFGDFEREFGGLDSTSLLSYGVQQFFLNGGSQAVIVRVAKDAKAATVKIPNTANPALTVSSQDASDQSNNLRVAVDPGNDEKTFALRVLDSDGTLLETFRNLSMDSNDPNFVETTVNPQSSYITVEAQGADRPPFSGTVSDPVPDPLPDLTDAKMTANIGSDGTVPPDITLYGASDPKPATLGELAILLERKLRAGSPKRGFSGARVNVYGRRLQVLAGEPGSTLAITGAVANTLKLTSATPTAYPLQNGDGGKPPGNTEFLGNEANKSGLNALRDVADVNLLCLPDLASADYVGDPIAVITAAEAICQDKRMLLIVDSPPGWATVDAARAGLSTFDSVRGDHAAMYFPHIRITDPLTGQPRSLPPSGAVAGIMARTDGERGVWKAPAGNDALLTGVRELTVKMTDLENGLLNPLALNCLRTFPIIGPVVWGARTLDGGDASTSQWKYVPVRRLALMLEESLYRGLKWVVFEPNDERLWGQIRLNVGAFLNSLFTRGAFQGTSARDAYFVKVDKETTTQNDIDNGIVKIIVGFAPLKPAEFVVIQIEQIAGQIQV
jgi:phage tail sheath protein FI